LIKEIILVSTVLGGFPAARDALADINEVSEAIIDAGKPQPVSP